AGGLVGKITKVEDHYVHVELTKGMTVKAVRNTIGEVLSSRDKPAAND
ncbi:MAG TPA: preprotein translocase subunit YajC, partial [Erythrobacter sp.]|nr:preprotein translocase subunit YajC [Erythrobacter sp.]